MLSKHKFGINFHTETHTNHISSFILYIKSGHQNTTSCKRAEQTSNFKIYLKLVNKFYKVVEYGKFVTRLVWFGKKTQVLTHHYQDTIMHKLKGARIKVPHTILAFLGIVEMKRFPFPYLKQHHHQNQLSYDMDHSPLSSSLPTTNHYKIILFVYPWCTKHDLPKSYREKQKSWVLGGANMDLWYRIFLGQLHRLPLRFVTNIETPLKDFEIILVSPVRIVEKQILNAKVIVFLHFYLLLPLVFKNTLPHI